MLSLFSSSNSYLKNSTSRPPHETLNSLQGGNEKSASDSMKFTQGAMTAASGTIAYMAPELLTNQALRGDVTEVSYSQSVDVYAMGCILWEALCLDRVWGQYNFSTQVIDKVVSGERPELPEKYEFPLVKPPQAYFALMKSLWNQNSAQRPKFRYICECLETLLKMDNSSTTLAIHHDDNAVSTKLDSAVDILMDGDL